MTAPALPPWPDGLPDAIERADGVLLPPALAEATFRRLLVLDTFPARCQAHLDATVKIHEALAVEAAAKAVDDYRAQHPPDPRPWWRPYLVPGGIGLLALGVVLGAVAT